MKTRLLSISLSTVALLVLFSFSTQSKAQSTSILQFVTTGVLGPESMILLDSLMSAQPGMVSTRSDFFTRNFVGIVDNEAGFDELSLRTLLFPYHLGLDCHQLNPNEGQAILPISARICERNDY